MPWADIEGQERVVRLLRCALEHGTLHHAYLLAGPEGVGKELLARLFAQAANCEREAPAARPCGTCFTCAGIARGNFPDVQWVMPQAELVARGLASRADLEGVPSREVRVDEVRAVARRLAFAPLRGRRKIVIVTPAETMNERAQNTLLKTLEEPPAATTFLLVSSQPDQLLPTVRSRCARVQLGPLGAELIARRLVATGLPADEAQARAARAEGSLSRALALSAEAMARGRQLLAEVEVAIAGADERVALDLAEALSERAAAVEAARALLKATRDELVALAGAASPPPEALPETTLLAQHALLLEIGQALEQNGNPRLQIERLLLGMRELRPRPPGIAHG